MPPPASYQLRPATEGDRDFQFLLYASTREKDIEALGPEAAQPFIEQQFLAQTHHYTSHHPKAEWFIVEVEGHPAGRLILDWGEEELNLMDIALMPAFRSQGLGTALLNSLFEQARERGVSIRLHAFTGERAIQLYQRLGFEPVKDDGIHTMLRWKA